MRFGYPKKSFVKFWFVRSIIIVCFIFIIIVCFICIFEGFSFNRDKARKYFLKWFYWTQHLGCLTLIKPRVATHMNWRQTLIIFRHTNLTKFSAKKLMIFTLPEIPFSESHSILIHLDELRTVGLIILLDK